VWRRLHDFPRPHKRPESRGRDDDRPSLTDPLDQPLLQDHDPLHPADLLCCDRLPAPSRQPLPYEPHPSDRPLQVSLRDTCRTGVPGRASRRDPGGQDASFRGGWPRLAAGWVPSGTETGTSPGRPRVPRCLTSGPHRSAHGGPGGRGQSTLVDGPGPRRGRHQGPSTGWGRRGGRGSWIRSVGPARPGRSRESGGGRPGRRPGGR